MTEQDIKEQTNPSPHFKAGDRLENRYELIEPLSSSTTRWVATDIETGARVVVRQLFQGLEQSRQSQLRQQTAALIERVKRVAHPGLCRDYSLITDQATHFLVRGFITGFPLDRVAELTQESLLASMARLCEVLNAMQTEQLSHSAIKAANVLIDNEGSLSLVDIDFEKILLRRSDAETARHLSDRDRVDLACLLVDASSESTGSSRTVPWALKDALDTLSGSSRTGYRITRPLASLLSTILTPDPLDASSNAHQLPDWLDLRDQLDDIRLSLSRGSVHRVTDTWRVEEFVSRAEAQTDDPKQTSSVAESLVHAAMQEKQTDSARRFLLPAMAVMFAITVAVLFQLALTPDKETAPTETPAVEIVAEEEAPVADEPEPLTEEELQLLFEQREQAQAVLDELIVNKLALEERAVEQWAAEPYQQLLNLKTSGDAAYQLQQFVEAGTDYSAALEISGTLIEAWPQRFESTIEQGLAAIEAGDSTASTAAFVLAQAIDPDNPLAISGLKRSGVLDQVLSLSKQAMAHAREERLEDALAQYSQARELDPETTGIDENINSITQRINDRDYRAHMSDALSALERQDLLTARDAFNRAAAIQPGSQAVRDGLADIDRRQRDVRVQNHQIRISQLISEERWQDASRHFDEILARDPDAAFAQQGKHEAVERAKLDEELNGILSAPQRWWSNRGREQMSAVLARANAIADKGPRLSTQIRQLTEQLQVASSPVEVALESDNLCQVVIYRVSQLGQFSATSLSLQPGQYTIVGTRPGYRDVRKTLQVYAGIEPEPVSVMCDEKV